MEPLRTLKPSRMRTFGPTFPSRREDSAQAIMDWLSSLMMPSMTSIAALKDKCCMRRTDLNGHRRCNIAQVQPPHHQGEESLRIGRGTMHSRKVSVAGMATFSLKQEGGSASTSWFSLVIITLLILPLFISWHISFSFYRFYSLYLFQDAALSF